MMRKYQFSENEDILYAPWPAMVVEGDEGGSLLAVADEPSASEAGRSAGRRPQILLPPSS